MLDGMQQMPQNMMSGMMKTFEIQIRSQDVSNEPSPTERQE